MTIYLVTSVSKAEAAVHPVFCATTLTFPVPAVPQSTVILAVVPPEACVPPVIVQVYVLLLSVTEYETAVSSVHTSVESVIADVVGPVQSKSSPKAYCAPSELNPVLIAIGLPIVA